MEDSVGQDKEREPIWLEIDGDLIKLAKLGHFIL
jgi:hypothetical protein